MTLWRLYSNINLQGLRKIMETSFGIADDQTEIKTRHLTNGSMESNHHIKRSIMKCLLLEWGSEFQGSIWPPNVDIKVQPWIRPEVSRRYRFPDFKTIGTKRWWGCQPYAPAAITPRKYSWYPFLLEAVRRFMSMKNSIDIIKNRTRDLQACSAVLQPTTALIVTFSTVLSEKCFYLLTLRSLNSPSRR